MAAVIDDMYPSDAISLANEQFQHLGLNGEVCKFFWVLIPTWVLILTGYK